MTKEIAIRLGDIEAVAISDMSIQEVEATLLLLNSSSLTAA
jgi:hypothetical protein